MAVIADRVVVELEAKLGQYNANLKRAEQNFNRSINSQQADMRRLESQISRSSGAIGGSLRMLAGTFAAAFSVQQVQQLADGYTRFTNQLRVAGVEGDRLASVQEKLFGIAQQYGVELESLGTLYSRGAQVSNELGASQADLIQFSSGVAAALKIQGSSAAAAQGALLQLSQALGAGTVRAEEFNSINEGAMPILKAVAQNLDAAGGSVAKLKTLVNDGKVTSEAFFRAFLAGTAQLEEQAANATLTIGNSFTVLNNALGLYIGQADESLSATERISSAIISLSENLDTVTQALGVLAAVLLGRYVAGAVAATTATGVMGTAIFAMQARAIGAATTMEALALASTTAGRAMLAAFGGPVGIAVAALAVGIYYLATRTDQAATASAQYRAELETAATVADKVRDATDRLATATGRARAEALANAKALRQETQQYLANARAALEAARAKAFEIREENKQEIARAARTTTGAGGGADRLVTTIAANDRRIEQAEANRAAANAAVLAYQREIIRLEKAINAPPPVVNVTPTTTKPKKGPTGPDPAQEAERRARAEAEYANELAQLDADELAAKAELTGNIRGRAAAELARIEADAAAFARQVGLDKELSDAQREKLLAERAQVDVLLRQKIEQEARLAEMDKAKRLADASTSLEQEIIRAQLGLTESRQGRARLERRLYDLQISQERAELEHTIATLELLGIENEELTIARARLERLKTLEGLERAKIEKDNASPLERYRDKLDKSDEEIADEAEQLIVDEIEHVRGAMRDALADAIGTDDPLITGLLDLLIEQVILKPLTDALAGAASGGGGIGGAVGTFISGLVGGRASGGHVRGGNLYRVTDGEGFMPAGSGKIIPLGRMRGAGGSNVTLRQTVNVDARGVNPDGFAEHIKAAVRQETIAIVGAGMKTVSARVPARMAQFERDGT